MTGLLPLTGVTLPFLSFGGTSLLFMMLALGMVNHISQYTSHQMHERAIAMKVLAAGGGSGATSHRFSQLLMSYIDLRRSSMSCLCAMRHLSPASPQADGACLVPVRVQRIAAGKLRRYHNQTWRETVADWRTIVFQYQGTLAALASDFAKSLATRAFPARCRLCKGGYVCLPLGLAAKMCRIPLVIRGSDTRPSLTNSILGRFADVIATGSPLENYRYPKGRSHYARRADRRGVSSVQRQRTAPGKIRSWPC